MQASPSVKQDDVTALPARNAYSFLPATLMSCADSKMLPFQMVQLPDTTSILVHIQYSSGAIMKMKNIKKSFC